MKQSILTLLLFCSIAATAQTYQYEYAIDEPASTLQIELTESQDSVIVFTFTSLEGISYDIAATGAYWRNGDFITLAPVGAWLEVSYRIVGRVTFRKLKKA